MKTITIGRDPNNVVVIKDHTVSRHHMQITQHDDGRIILSDLQSVNGTYVNGQRVEGTVELHYGDIVKIGDTTLNWEYYSLAEALKNLPNESPTRPPFKNAMCYSPAPPPDWDPNDDRTLTIVIISSGVLGFIIATTVALFFLD